MLFIENGDKEVRHLLVAIDKELNKEHGGIYGALCFSSEQCKPINTPHMPAQSTLTLVVSQSTWWTRGPSGPSERSPGAPGARPVAPDGSPGPSECE